MSARDLDKHSSFHHRPWHDAVMDAQVLAALMSPTGQELLASLPPYDASAAMALGKQLRGAGLEPELAAALLTQSRLRAKAVAKFGEFAASMLFTADGLEQATRLAVAGRHAARFRDAGIRHVADLTCGIGADALAMAGLGLDVTAIDIDETTATIAGFNLRQFPNARILSCDALALDLSFADGVWADPARRRGGKRTHDPAAYSPTLADIIALRTSQPTPAAALGIKVGPGIAHRDIPSDAAAEWTSVDGEVVEAALWFGVLAHDEVGVRSATVLRKDQVARIVDDGTRPSVGPLGEFLYEPDGAVIRAHALGALAARLGAHQIDPTIAYLTTSSDLAGASEGRSATGIGPSSDQKSAPEPSASSDGMTSSDRTTLLATRWRVLDSIPFNLKALRAYLRARNVGHIVVKKRGTAVSEAQLRAKLSLRGPESVTIILTRVAGAQRVIIVEEAT